MYLNVGSNLQTVDGFVNIDIEPIADVCCDARWNLPFADGAFEGVYSEHFIEHIPQADAVGFLRECRRVTCLGGRIRIATPDLRWLVERYESDDWRYGDMFSHGFDWVATRAEQLNIAMREWGHQWMYDEEELTRLGAMAGLHLVGSMAHGASDVDAFVGRETRPDSRLILEFENRRPLVRTDTPLVSILIAAYRPEFLDEALRSASAQTWPNIEILVGDDCPTEQVREIVERRAAEDGRIVYERNPLPTGTRRNYYRLFERAKGEYLKYLNDDDVLHPTVVERMARTLNAMPRVTLVTSHRRRISSTGRRLPDDGSTKRPVIEDSIIDGPGAASSMLATAINWIGEPSTTMYRRSDITDNEPELYAFAGRAAIENGDVTLWTRLLSRGDLCYLSDTLSFFRQHPGQVQAAPEFLSRAVAAWERICFDGKRMGMVGPAQRTPRVTRLGIRPWWSSQVATIVAAAEAVSNAGDAASALCLLAEARALVPTDTGVALIAAELATAINDPQAALDATAEAARLADLDVRLLYLRAETQERLGRHSEASASLRAADRAAPKEPEPRRSAVVTQRLRTTAARWAAMPKRLWRHRRLVAHRLGFGRSN